MNRVDASIVLAAGRSMTVGNKIYLLIDNLDYYPGFGTADWHVMYSTKAIAEATMHAQREARLAEILTVV